jgi:hypothetical protein
MTFPRLDDLLALLQKLMQLCIIVFGIALLLFVFTAVEHSNKTIVKRPSIQAASIPVLFLPSIEFSEDEHRIAKLFIADTLPRLLKMGLISKYRRNESITLLSVPGRIWKTRTRFVKESLLTAVSVYNRVNGFSPWTRILDDRTGAIYAQVLPSNQKELYE